MVFVNDLVIDSTFDIMIDCNFSDSNILAFSYFLRNILSALLFVQKNIKSFQSNAYYQNLHEVFPSVKLI